MGDATLWLIEMGYWLAGLPLDRAAAVTDAGYLWAAVLVLACVLAGIWMYRRGR